MPNPIRIKGKFPRKELREAFETTAHTLMLDKDLEEELKDRYFGGSLQIIVYALILEATGHINLKKDKKIDIGEVIRDRIEKKLKET